MIEARDKVRHRVGKQPMFRSQRKQETKKEAPKKIDPERLNFLRYLEGLEEDPNAAAQK